jgi:hypothetical protein
LDLEINAGGFGENMSKIVSGLDECTDKPHAHKKHHITHFSEGVLERVDILEISDGSFVNDASVELSIESHDSQLLSQSKASKRSSQSANLNEK